MKSSNNSSIGTAVPNKNEVMKSTYYYTVTFHSEKLGVNIYVDSEGIPKIAAKKEVVVQQQNHNNDGFSKISIGDAIHKIGERFVDGLSVYEVLNVLRKTPRPTKIICETTSSPSHQQHPQKQLFLDNDDVDGLGPSSNSS